MNVIESFVARIWLERGPNGDPVWCGHIQHVQGRQEAYFQDLGEMSEFLEQVSGIPGPELTAWPAENTVMLESSATASARRKRKASTKRKN
jgi:hypothetical protein